MNTVFIGGSRHVSRLPAEIKTRLDNVISSGHQVIIGDANGADKAVQKHLHDLSYDKVTVFCSGDTYRNNLGHWRTHHVQPNEDKRGFQFHAAKDREMARKADFGLMIWDGKSCGTILNVLRLVRAGKIAVLFNVPEKRTFNFKSSADWDEFLAKRSEEFRKDLRERAAPDEWSANELPVQSSFLDTPTVTHVAAREDTPPKTDKELADEINAAFAAGDIASAIAAIGEIARARGMGQVAKDAGLARESLYRSLHATGNPELTTVVRVISSLGMRLLVEKAS